jgi:DNA helicase II / ATP-dependent DNA helicase PcrA
LAAGTGVVRYIADLHIHSPYSRATSKLSSLYGLAAWAAVKGINVVGTGDFTHPGWQRQIGEHLEEAEPGFFRLKSAANALPEGTLPAGLQTDPGSVRFLLSSEISSIYKKDGRVRKVHNILFAPDVSSVRRISSVLAGIGNLESDGRPILGLDSRDLLEIMLEQAPEGFLVPAHIWTPWFSLFGSRSGFDAIEECFGDLTGHIFALETGLSSDPDMNRLISALDRFSLISNSDCHSPAKLGREANIFTTGFDFYSLRDALRQPVDAEGRQRFAATVEFYPEEGKYHLDGHRKCGVSLEPAATRKLKGICPVCGNPLTVGVLSRVMELADRDLPHYPSAAPEVHSLVPLPELLGELLRVGPSSRRVAGAYAGLIRRFGSELTILLEADTAALARKASPLLAEAVERVRAGRVIRIAGYDGVYGSIRVFSDRERKEFGGQMQLFGSGTVPAPSKKKRPGIHSRPPRASAPGQPIVDRVLNPEQLGAVASDARHIIVKAGPGTGKTHTLVQRVVRHVREGRTPCTVITFTNRAADELRQRLASALGKNREVEAATLHGYCLRWLRHSSPDLQAAGPELRRFLLRTVYPELSSRELGILDGEITAFLQSAPDMASTVPVAMDRYFARLEKERVIDLEAVVPAAMSLLKTGGRAAGAMRRATGRLFIDEFQDLNRSQFELVRLLGETVPVFAIGDPDQAIYGFRGSSPQWFFAFMHDLRAEQHVLHRNYRSASTIVRAAASVISGNHRGDSAAPCTSVSGRIGAIYSVTAASPRAEAGFILRQIEALVGGTSHREIDRLHAAPQSPAALSDIAVLYRTGRQAEVIADLLIRHGFPVQVVDLKPYYVSGPAHPLYLWMLLAAGLEESSDLLTLAGKEKGIGRSGAAAVEQLLGGVVRNPMAHLLRNRERLPARMQSVLTEMAATGKTVRQTARDEGVASALRRLLPRYGLKEDEADIVRLFSLADNFSTSLEPFALHLKRCSDTVVYDDRAEAVTLMTLHASKGLEFKVVFIAGLEEGLLPLSTRSVLSPAGEENHFEEERRLLYVGMTRAEEILYLCRVRKRSVQGRVIVQEPSRFFAEIPAELISPLDGRAAAGRKKSRVKQLSLFG